MKQLGSVWLGLESTFLPLSYLFSPCWMRGCSECWSCGLLSGLLGMLREWSVIHNCALECHTPGSTAFICNQMCCLIHRFVDEEIDGNYRGHLWLEKPPLSRNLKPLPNLPIAANPSKTGLLFLYILSTYPESILALR